MLRVDEAHDRRVQRDARGDEDREHDEESGELLPSRAAQVEGDPERNRGECVTRVVNQVRKQRDAVGREEDERLGERGDAEDAEADRNRADAVPRPDDRAVYEAVRMSVPVRMVVTRVVTRMFMIAGMTMTRLPSTRLPSTVPMRPLTMIVNMLVVITSMAMIGRET
jgi:hypothetical protein